PPSPTWTRPSASAGSIATSRSSPTYPPPWPPPLASEGVGVHRLPGQASPAIVNARLNALPEVAPMGWYVFVVTASFGLMADGPAWVDGPPSSERDVRAILKAYCFQCHGEAAKPKGGLDLRLARLALRGGDSGPAIVPGDLNEGLLW